MLADLFRVARRVAGWYALVALGLGLLGGTGLAAILDYLGLDAGLTLAQVVLKTLPLVLATGAWILAMWALPEPRRENYVGRAVVNTIALIFTIAILGWAAWLANALTGTTIDVLPPPGSGLSDWMFGVLRAFFDAYGLVNFVGAIAIGVVTDIAAAYVIFSIVVRVRPELLIQGLGREGDKTEAEPEGLDRKG